MLSARVCFSRTSDNFLRVKDGITGRAKLDKIGEDRLDLRLRAVHCEQAHRVARQNVRIVDLTLEVQHQRPAQLGDAARVGPVGLRGGGAGGASLSHVQLADTAKVARQVEAWIMRLEEEAVAADLWRELEGQARGGRRALGGRSLGSAAGASGGFFAVVSSGGLARASSSIASSGRVLAIRLHDAV